MCAYTKIGIIKEGKTPPDKRVTLSPQHCKELLEKYAQLDLVVQRSDIRAFSDEEYEAAGVPLVDNLDDRELIIGVKEVPLDMLIPNKAYLFFSHTTKKQPYNKKLLQTICDKGITLMDHELLAKDGKRVIAFGRFAGIVGAYNGLRGYLLKTRNINIKPAHQCADQVEMQAQLANIEFSSELRIVLTGDGRVGKGAMEVLDAAGIQRVEHSVIEAQSNSKPCYSVLDTNDMYVHQERGDYQREEFYSNPEHYRSLLAEKLDKACMYIACHYWNPKGPMLLEQKDLQALSKLKIIADISCDIKKPIASTLRPSTIAEPLFGYDRNTGNEVPFEDADSLGVMSVDNLPCELPRDASLAFGQQFMVHVASNMIESDNSSMIKEATITLNGAISEQFAHLKEWLSAN